MDVGGCGWMYMDVDVCGCISVWGYVDVHGCGWTPRSMAWVRRSMGIMCRPLGKMTFFCQNDVFFLWGAQIACKSRRTTFYVFWLFTPLFRRFRLPRVSQRTDLDEIYRLVSKILHFTRCGSVFGRFR